MSKVSAAVPAPALTQIPRFDQVSNHPYEIPACCAYGLITNFGGGYAASGLTHSQAKQWWNNYAERNRATVLFANVTGSQRDAHQALLAGGWECVKEFESITTGSTIYAMMFLADWYDAGSDEDSYDYDD